jgi:phosphate transport system substrate-binding protein
MKCWMPTLTCLILLSSCAAPVSPQPPAQPAPPELRADLRIVSLPVSDDLEELGTYFRMGLPMDVFASVTVGQEPIVSKVVSRATLIGVTQGTEARSASVMLAVPRDDVELLLLTRDLVRRKQASFYLAAGPRTAPAIAAGKEKALPLRQMLSRLGYEVAERPAVPPAPEPVVAHPVPATPAKVDPVPLPAAPDPLALPERLPEGRLLMDGSSTVFPMAKLARDEFTKRYAGVQVELMGINPGESPSGSGGGFKRFCFGETDISNSSRMIKDDEIRKCAANKVSFLELPVAYDGLSVVVNRENTWVNYLTVPELKAIWSQDSKVQTWHDVRPEFPSRPIRLFSPGRDNGTYDYFTEMIFGKPDVAPRQDVVVSTTPEILVREIVSTPEALSYFGLAYFVEHKEALKLVAIDGGKGPVLPTSETVLDGTYAPFSRPLFIYVNTQSLARPEVRAFVRYFLGESNRIAQAVGYIPLPADLSRLSRDRMANNLTGSVRPLGQQAVSLRAMMLKQ